MRAFIADIQAVYSANIAGTQYNRIIIENSNTTARHRELFCQTSQNWHYFLGFESTHIQHNHQAPGTQHKPNLWEVETAEACIKQRYNLYQTNIEEVFQHIMENGAMALRGNQGSVLQAIKYRNSYIVAVMSISGDKSALFILPVWVSNSAGLTIVVVLLIALHSDIMTQCQDLGIRYAVWDLQRPPDKASIVLVTSEAILSEAFVNFINRQRIFQQLNRIVVDEYYIILSQNPVFRPLLQQIDVLRAVSTQIVLLTAILLPGEKQTLWYCMDWQRKYISLYCNPTSRHNIAYRVHTIFMDNGFDKQF